MLGLSVAGDFGRVGIAAVDFVGDLGFWGFPHFVDLVDFLAARNLVESPELGNFVGGNCGGWKFWWLETLVVGNFGGWKPLGGFR